MADKMKAVAIHNGHGGARNLYMNDASPKPIANSGEAIIKIKAFGLNRMDLLQREGLYPVPPQAPETLGVEFSGLVESIGPGADEAFKIGDAVFGLAYGGAYAEYIAVSTQMLLHKPDHLSWEQAAGIPETWITALQALHLVGRISAKQTILWHAGASSVSIAGIQLSRLASASQIFVTAGSQEKIDFCVQSLGATAGFNYRTQDWCQEILAATDGKGVDIVIDFIGQKYFQSNLEVVAKDGVIVQLGTMSGTLLHQAVDIGAFVRKRVRFEGSTLRSRDLVYQRKLRDMLAERMELFESGKLSIFVAKVMPWTSICEAHEKMESNELMGKIICTVE